jgi:hypothetical protein
MIGDGCGGADKGDQDPADDRRRGNGTQRAWTRLSGMASALQPAESNQ